jgi:response regulator RpfG family c-di-GMP phosphodiesterase
MIRWLSRLLSIDNEATQAPSEPAKARRSSDQRATAAIISTDLDPAILQRLMDDLQNAGFEEVIHFAAVDGLVADPARAPLPQPLWGRSVLVLDERIGAHSVFEILERLKAAPELQEATYFLLLSYPVSQETLTVIYTGGFDRFLLKPPYSGELDLREFPILARRVRDSLAGED